MKPLLSVVVPVYNAEEYLDECIRSILKQTIENIEVILVDDSSTDLSKSIIKEYENKDHRIKAIYNDKNYGPSKSRNLAIDIAQGEFIGFVDSDDYISNDMFEKMYQKAILLNSDIVTCGYQMFQGNKNLPSRPLPFEPGKLINHQEMIAYIAKAHDNKFLWFTWRNIYRNKLIKDNKIYFDEDIRFGEDNIFNLYAFFHAKGIVSIDEKLYYYRNNPNSLTKSKYKPYLNNSLMNEFNRKKEFYNKYSLMELCKADFSMYITTHLLPIMLENAKNGGENIREIMKSEMVKESLKSTPIIVNKRGHKIRLIILMAKLKQLKLLDLFLTKIYPA